MAKNRFTNKARMLAKMERIAPEIVMETRKGLAATAGEIVDMQRRLVAKKSGALARSIQWQFGDVKRVAYSQGNKAGGRLSVRISAGDSKVRYAHLVEFGAAPHTAGGIFDGEEHPGAPAQPFFYAAFRAKRKRAKSRIAAAMKRGAKKAVSS